MRKALALIAATTAAAGGVTLFKHYHMPRICIQQLRFKTSNQRKQRKARRQRFAAGDRRAFA